MPGKFGLLLLSAFVCVKANADVTDKLVYSYYLATARPSVSIGVTLNNVSPVHDGARIFHSHTSWNINWNYRWDEKPDGRCKMVRVYVDLDSKIILPSLLNASPEQQQRFDTYLTALRAHELGHVNFGKQAAFAIEQAIINLPELTSCKALDAAANATANQLLDKYRQKEIQYDADTEHGKKQGAYIN